MSSWTQTEAPSCTEDGEKERHCVRANCSYSEIEPIDAMGHSYSDATCMSSEICSRCGEFGEPALGHTPSEDWSCDANIHYHRCKNVGCTEWLDVSVHELVTKTTTETVTDGYIVIVFDKCDTCAFKTELGRTIQHVHNDHKVLEGYEPTCTEDGLTFGVKCNTCGEILLAQETKDALGHLFVEGECQRCGEKEFSEELELQLVNASDYGIYYVVKSIGDCTSEHIVIPNCYQGKPVLKISDSAFKNCTFIKDVYIPNSIVTIGANAFRNCTNLTSVDIPNSVKSIGSAAFMDCSNLVNVSFEGDSVISSLQSSCFANCCALSNFAIPNSVSSVGQNVFSGCTSIVVVVDGISYVDKWVIDCDESISTTTLREGTVGIAEYALSRCNFTSLTLCDSLIYVNMSALYGADIESIFITKNVEIIDQSAFASCYNLKSVKFADDCNLTFIGSLAFKNCRALTTITIPKSVTYISSWSPWTGCSNLTSINIEEGNEHYRVEDNVLYDKEMTILIHYVDRPCLTKFVVPSTVKEISDYAFYGKTSLLELVLPEGVIEIGAYSITNCTNLVSVSLPSTLKNTASVATSNSGNQRLVEVVNNSPISIAVGQTDLTTNAIEVHSGVSEITTIEDFLFYSYNDVHYLIAYVGNNSSPVLPESYNGEPYVINDYAFYGCEIIDDLTIPNNVTRIGKNSFALCGLDSIVFESDSRLETIGGWAFYDHNSSCEEIIIPKSVVSIEEYAFVNMRIKNLAFESGSVLETIGNGAFSFSSITGDLVLPKTLKSIGENAFRYSDIENIYYLGAQDEWLQISIAEENDVITQATVYYYSENEPIAEGCHWHCVDGVITKW